MRTKHLGCLSASGILAALLTLGVILGINAARGGAMYSPGKLNAQTGDLVLGGVRSHADLSERCSACHTAAWEPERMADRCLECHTELVVSDRDFHQIMLAQSQRVTCLPCHTDHNGPQASLTSHVLADFPHDQFGFSLAAHRERGDGQSFICSDCHVERIAQMDITTCLDCHKGIDSATMAAHIADFGADCISCHDGIDTYGEAFDHNRAAFPLEGAHAQVGCGECHLSARTIADLRQAPVECEGCHLEDDAHAGRFGPKCGVCHSSIAWEPATFDHSLAAFPLTGKHTQVECEACHKGDVFQGTPQSCDGCHLEDDAHAGQFGRDCGACHTPEDWDLATFDHNQTSFPLTGAHERVECAGCHQNNVFAGTASDCASCHDDPAFHAGLFGAGCADCHSTQSWSPARFEQAHTFPIGHGESGPSDCKVCHPQSLSIYTCYGCHEHTPAEIEAKHREEGIGDFQDCVRCHATGQEGEGEGEGGDD